MFNDEMRAAFVALYAPLQPPLAPHVVVYVDIAYGPDERHKIDVFAPAEKPVPPAPVVVHFPGAHTYEPIEHCRARRSIRILAVSGQSLSSDLLDFVKGLK